MQLPSMLVLCYPLSDGVFAESVDLVILSLGWSALQPVSHARSALGDTCCPSIVLEATDELRQNMPPYQLNGTRSSEHHIHTQKDQYVDQRETKISLALSGTQRDRTKVALDRTRQSLPSFRYEV